MSLQLVESMHDRLSNANRNWPRNAFSNAQGRAIILEKRLARAARGRDVDYCISSAVEEADGSVIFAATLFTEDLVISGELRANEEQSDRGQIFGDVAIVSRSAIRSLTLHHVEYFGYDNEESEDYVSFTASYEGMASVVVGPPSSGAPRMATSLLFDALQADLTKI